MSSEPADLTGNDYVSIGSITRAGAVDGVNVIHALSGGLVEWTGAGDDAPLLRPEVIVDGTPLELATGNWRRHDRWIPSLELTTPDSLIVTAIICAPGGYPSARGFVVSFDFENRGRKSHSITVRLHLTWRRTKLWIATERLLAGRNQLRLDAGCLCLETDDGRGPALAITGTPAPTVHGSGDGSVGELPAGAVMEARNGESLRVTLEQTVTVQGHRRSGAGYFIGAGRERDGAAAASFALRRLGQDHWVRQARLEVSHILRAGENPQRSELLNRNLLFNRFYAVGRAIDDDRLYLLRSRSTRCPAPAVFNEREALLWTIPALILSDPALAREAIFRVFDLFSERSGDYQRYIDGGAYDTAFVLDQLPLYAWIADHYIRATGDDSLLDEPLLRQVIFETDTGLFLRLHPQHLLCSTDLLPSGDLADHPFPTFGNALAWVFCETLTRLWSRGENEPPLRFEGAAQELAATIWQHCTTEIDGVAVLASSTNLEGEAAVYDDPVGTLALLPFFGFCPPDDPVWHDTMEFLRSRRYPLWRDDAVPGLGARTDRAHGRTAALCADLLGPRREEALRTLLKLKLPQGVAAAAYRTDTGEAIEPHHAALAGFLAWAMPRGSEKTEKPPGRRGRARK